MIYKCKRTTSVRSKDQCTLGALSEDSFTELCLDYPHIEHKLKEQSYTYTNTWKAFQLEQLTQVYYLKGLKAKSLEHLHYSLHLTHFEHATDVYI